VVAREEGSKDGSSFWGGILSYSQSMEKGKGPIRV